MSRRSTRRLRETEKKSSIYIDGLNANFEDGDSESNSESSD